MVYAVEVSTHTVGIIILRNKSEMFIHSLSKCSFCDDVTSLTTYGLSIDIIPCSLVILFVNILILSSSLDTH